ncbi:GIY-YIG nuclease family protein [Planococcus maritimus]|uniref:GIY-YIG nuclease family protein n=1 Tax=Planococcus maritimus TaxID=192421 RepID=A0A7D7MII2_PLAMR|nr:GIY-YIG nuclease family protein [Planococcus maritimus]KYG58653.1 endonuclease [Planococcus maritimus]OED30969.1 endonuclease [Planococcus maritimus]QMT17508.1 GIY-YIG nuclease family protein [Planococcus maritimus]
MEARNKHFFYVLECGDGSYYAGYTNDLEKRLATHQSGKGAKYTRSRGPLTLIHHESFDTKPEAMKAEYAFKQLSKAEKIVYIRTRKAERT